MKNMPADDELNRLQKDVNRRRRFVPAPPKMADVLSGLLARRGYAQVQTASTCDAAWRQAVGEKMSRHSRPGNIRRGLLEVTVRNSAVLQELTFQKRQLLAKIVGLLPDQKIKDLKFKVGPLD